MSKRETRILLSVLLNISFAILEVIGGFWTNSLAILSDALHDFGDSVALLTSLILERKAKKDPDNLRTFGYQRLSLFSALFSGIVLVGGSLGIIAQVIPRLFNPEVVNTSGMVGIAISGIIFNGLGFVFLKKGESLNEKVLSWHLMEDVLGWILVLIGAGIIRFWDIYLIDPAMTLGLTVFILYNVITNLREVFNILLEGVPQHISIEGVKGELSSIKGVLGVHDIHIWSLEGETDLLTGHIVVDDRLLKTPDQTRRTIKDVLTKHHIEHSTIELETIDYCSGIECEAWHIKNSQAS
jgi:cobalt-zinc-cadmium efflux system protein